MNYPSLDYVTSVYIASHDVITVFCVSRVKTAVFRDIHSVDSRQHHSSRGQRRQDEREMYIHRVPIKNVTTFSAITLTINTFSVPPCIYAHVLATVENIYHVTAYQGLGEVSASVASTVYTI